MAGAAVLGRLTSRWAPASVTEVVTETPTVQTLLLDVDGWAGHRAGQHLDVRLTAEDGYTAQRSYSIASAPGEPPAITVERLDDGEVSPYLVDVARPGDEIEVRGPIGGWFVWDPSDGGPLLLVGGGSGVVPLMAMLRHRAASGSDVPAKLLLSSRTWDDVIYRDELESLGGRGDGLAIVHTLTRGRPDGWSGYSRRVDLAMLGEVAWSPAGSTRAYVCGPTAFVEIVAEGLVALGYDAGRVRTERFGATS